MNTGPAVTLLIVDDDYHLRFLLVGVLRKAFPLARLVEAANADEGLNAALQEKPDVIITDQRMAGMTGLEMIAALRSQGLATPMILLTGALEPDAERFLKGASAVLEKIRFRALPGVIRTLLGGDTSAA